MARSLREFASEVELRPDDLVADRSGRIDWARAFGSHRPLRIEIGTGNSPFFIEVCRNAPAFNYLGFEYCGKRVLKFAKKVVQAKLDNLRIMRLDARVALEQFFLPESVDHFYINHPDPWPKRRHAKHRFIQQANVDTLTRLLASGGGISLRTDASAYAQQMLEVLDGTTQLVNTSGAGCFADAPLEPYATPFESKFRAQGLRIYYLEYRKVAGQTGKARTPGLARISHQLRSETQ